MGFCSGWALLRKCWCEECGARRCEGQGGGAASFRFACPGESIVIDFGPYAGSPAALPASPRAG